MFIIFRSLPLLHLAKLILPKELLWRKVSSFLMKAGIYRRAMRTVFPSIAELLQWGSTNRCFYFFAWFFEGVSCIATLNFTICCKRELATMNVILIFWNTFLVNQMWPILLILICSEENNNVLVFENNRERSSINLRQLSC